MFSGGGGGEGGRAGGGCGTCEPETEEEIKAREERERIRTEELKKRIVYECWAYKMHKGGAGGGTEDEQNKLRGQVDIGKKEAQKLQQRIHELKEKLKFEKEGKHVMMAQFQAQESKVTRMFQSVSAHIQGLREVQNSSVQERTLLHNQLQDADVKLALAAEAVMKEKEKTSEMSRMEQQMCALSDERDNCIKTTKQVEAQIHVWKKRYFVITADHRLNYYERPEDYYHNRAEGSLSCVGMLVKDRSGTEKILLSNSREKEYFTFTIQAKEGSRTSDNHFAFETNDGREKFIVIIASLILNAQRYT